VPLDNEPLAPQAESREQAECIAAALGVLPEHYEAVLRAKYLEGRSLADIAAQRRESPKAVESLLTRARQAFRQAYLEAE
jgi:RNA polymerase sigma-70 factor (ECF subfamily)